MMKPSYLKISTITYLLLSTSFASEDSIQNSNDRQTTNPIEVSSLWPRVKLEFDYYHFLDVAKKKFPDLVKMDDDIISNPETMLQRTWSTLTKIKEHYKSQNKIDEYLCIYQAMIKFYLSSNSYPVNFSSHEKKKEMIINFIDRFEEKISFYPDMRKKNKKWMNIYLGLLYRKYALEFARDERRGHHLESSYNAFRRAIELNTTKTSLLFMAEIILDQEFTPPQMTRQEAIRHAWDCIKKAQTSKQIEVKRQYRTTYKKSDFEEFAKPPYMRYIDEFSSFQPENIDLMESDKETNQSADDMDVDIQEDPLQDYDWSSIHILQSNQQPELDAQPRNTVGASQDAGSIDGVEQSLQNVSGENMRCFFNAFGIKPQIGAAQLRTNINHPSVRMMIANDIVSAARDKVNLPQTLRDAIGFDGYEAEQKLIDEKQELRAEHLRLNGNDTALLPADLSSTILNNQQDAALARLRVRALHLTAFEAFIRHFIENNEMMAFLPDIEDNNNFTAVDAFALVNKIGLEIYTLNDDNQLKLSHRYVPHEATTLRRLFYSPNHFQALIPSVSSEEIDLPNDKELEKLFPVIKIANGVSTLSQQTIRKILYYAQYKSFDYKKIERILGVPNQYISRICLNNGIKKYNRLDSDTKERIYLFVLEEDISRKNFSQHKDTFKEKLNREFRSDKITRRAIHFHQHYKTPSSQKALSADQISEIVRSFTSGVSLEEIRKKISTNMPTILNIIRKNISIDQLNKYKSQRVKTDRDKNNLDISFMDISSEDQKESTQPKAKKVTSAHIGDRNHVIHDVSPVKRSSAVQKRKRVILDDEDLEDKNEDVILKDEQTPDLKRAKLTTLDGSEKQNGITENISPMKRTPKQPMRKMIILEDDEL